MMRNPKDIIKREIAASRAAGRHPLAHFLIHAVQRVQQRFFSHVPTFKNNQGETVVPRHVFVHSLALDAAKAFRPNPDAQHDFESWFITRNEFLHFLNDAWNRGYILVRARDLLAGKIQLGKGKTPLVLSFDDTNYYDYMSGYGFAERMEADENGIRYCVRTDDGICRITDGDAPGVLEEFIKAHPEFSHDGARAIIAVTGYEGLLGYRRESDAAPAVAALKRLGYEFACHSWGHHHKIYTDFPPCAAKGILDISKWIAGVGQVIGGTDIFITPFGTDIRTIPTLLRFLKKNGFRYFFSVGTGSQICKTGKCFFADRLNLDGVFLRTKAHDYQQLFGDPESLYDKRRTIPLNPPKDNLSLVAFARECLSLKTVYVWDGLGEVLTHDFLNAKEKNYPDFQSHAQWLELHNRVDGETRGFDCSGLITRFLMGGFHHFFYRPELDLNACCLLQQATRRGAITKLPEIPGVCLHMDGHTGIYVGGGLVIESTPNPRFGNGVVQTKLSDRPWTQWYCCHGVNYMDAPIKGASPECDCPQ